MNRDDLKQTLEVLAAEADTIRNLEAEAVRAAATGDTAAHRARLRQKTELLAALPETLAGPLRRADQATANAVMQKAEDLSRRAKQAIKVDSPFFMAQLLYSEDYRDGDPNELEAFIASLDPDASG